MGQALNRFGNKEDKEFAKAIYESHGRGNNSLIRDLIFRNGCTADDVARVASKTENAKLLNNGYISSSDRSKNYRMARALNEYLYNEYRNDRGQKINKIFSRLSDYKWYFKYIPDHLLEDKIVYKENLRPLFVGDKTARITFDSTTKAIYIANTIATLIYKENYPSNFFAEKLRQSDEAIDEICAPFENKHLNISSDSFDHKHVKQYGMNNYMYSVTCPPIYDAIYERTNYDRENTTNYWDNVRVRDVLMICDLAAQIRVLTEIIDISLTSEMYGDATYGMDNGLSYAQYLLNNIRRKPNTKFKPSQTRLELFGQVKALEMLLAMGIGVRTNSSGNWGYYENNKKINKRIQTAYKTFIKAKTVDDRKNLRKLLVTQLNIISNDFFCNTFDFGELNFVKEQDEDFENNGMPKPRKSNAVGAPKGRTFDLDKLAQAFGGNNVATE